MMVCALLYGWVRYQAKRAVDESSLEAQAGNQVTVTATSVTPPRMDGIALWLQPMESRALAEFQGRIYVATAGGLVAYEPSGKLVRHYTAADGLPEHDLTSLAVFQNKLYLGTRTQGLLSFDGTVFTQYTIRKPQARSVSALCSTPRYLLIGTLDAGLFDFDGLVFSQRFQPSKGPEITGVTAIWADQSRLYVGTQKNGLFVWRDGELRVYGTADGLPSPRVTAIVSSGGDILVATDIGVVQLTDTPPFLVLSKQPNLTSLAEFQGKIWGGLVTGGAVEISRTPTPVERASSRFFAGGVSLGGTNPSHTVLAVADTHLWALTEAGMFQLEPQPNQKASEWKRWGSVPAGKTPLASPHVTSLAVDERGLLWIGYFERGLDVVSLTTGEREHHFQDEAVREINFLTSDPDTGSMLAATSAGLVVYDAGFKPRRYDEKSASLIGNNVAQVLRVPGFKAGSNVAPSSDVPLVLATARGLTVMQSGISRSLTAFHGLASNYLYCAELVGGKLYLGSLGGLMELDGLRVVRTWKTDTSKLSANWINALKAVNGTLYVGTYGGGVCALTPTGDIVPFEETASIEVNPNAMASDGERLYVGTLDQGLLLFDLTRREWRRWRTGLASPNVTSIAIHNGIAYCGTTGGLTQVEVKRLVE